MKDGQQLCECAYCGKIGTVYVRASLVEPKLGVEGFVCLGGPLLPSSRLRALCAGCVRGANAAFARRAGLAPGSVA